MPSNESISELENIWKVNIFHNVFRQFRIEIHRNENAYSTSKLLSMSDPCTNLFQAQVFFNSDKHFCLELSKVVCWIWRAFEWKWLQNANALELLILLFDSSAVWFPRNNFHKFNRFIRSLRGCEKAYIRIIHVNNLNEWFLNIPWYCLNNLIESCK